MFVDSDTITCTPEHPFYVNSAWVEAKKLKAGDKLLFSNGSLVAIDSLYEFKTDTATAVYNLEASGNHNYYVSNTKILVHNKGMQVGKIKQLLPKGFKEVKEFGLSHGQKVYKKGEYYYSLDKGTKFGGAHNGGVWKVFKKVGNRLKRIGTADENLNIFKQ